MVASSSSSSAAAAAAAAAERHTAWWLSSEWSVGFHRHSPTSSQSPGRSNTTHLQTYTGGR